MSETQSLTPVEESADKGRIEESSAPQPTRTRAGWPVWTAGYLGALSRHGQKTKAAIQADITLGAVFLMRQREPDFIIAEKAAMEDARAVFESEAVRRAVEGTIEEHYDRDGKLINKKIVFSDAIMLRLLERMETGSWRSRQQLEVGGPHSFPTLKELERDMSADLAEMKAIPAGEIGESQQACVKEDSSGLIATAAIEISVSASESA